jgi:hypothetical protein
VPITQNKKINEGSDDAIVFILNDWFSTLLAAIENTVSIPQMQYVQSY